MQDLIKTARLTLRRPILDDAHAMVALGNNLAIARMLSRLPHPYCLEHALEFRPKTATWWDEATGFVYAITKHDGTLIGILGIELMTGKGDDKRTGWEIGYWLGETYWGQGYVTEAARAALEAFEDAYPDAPVRAGHFNDNPASARVLAKLGFGPAPGADSLFSIARGEHVPHTSVRRLPARKLRAVLAEPLETDRMILRRPTTADLDGMIPLISDYDVAKMTASIPHPYEPAFATAWLERVESGMHNGHHFMLAAIEKATGAYLGTFGLHYGDDRPSVDGTRHDCEGWELGYWIGKPHWGKGFATEGGMAMVQAFSHAWPARHIHARYFTENPQSGRVLEKIGFYDTGIESLGKAIARGPDFRGVARNMLRPPPKEAGL